MNKILFLSTYPFIKPRHGGQIRLSKLVKEYQSNGWEASSIAVYEPESYVGDDIGDLDIPFPPDSKYRKFRGRNVPLITDLLSGQFAVSDDGGYKAITKHLPEKIDVIHLEQAWLWPLAKKIKDDRKNYAIKIVYGSQNVEYELKSQILSQYNVEDVDDVLEEIKSLEVEAACNADIVAAVTEEDAKKIEAWGAKSVIVAPNGIEPWKARDDKLAEWSERLPKSPWLLYVASAHPPNFTSFNECIGESLACFPPDSKLVIVGSVCEHIYHEIVKSKWGNINISRIELLYLLNDDDLQAVKSLAHGYFLPIKHGGGSNLKTAEAIYSGAHVLGTESSFRGFEKFTSIPRVKRFNQPAEFHENVRNILSMEKPIRTDEESTLCESLTWNSCLNNLIKSVDRCVKESINA